MFAINILMRHYTIIWFLDFLLCSSRATYSHKYAQYTRILVSLFLSDMRKTTSQGKLRACNFIAPAVSTQSSVCITRIIYRRLRSLPRNDVRALYDSWHKLLQRNLKQFCAKRECVYCKESTSLSSISLKNLWNRSIRDDTLNLSSRKWWTEH